MSVSNFQGAIHAIEAMHRFCGLKSRYQGLKKKYRETKDQLRARDRDNWGLVKTLNERDVTIAESQAGSAQKEKDHQEALPRLRH